MVTIEANGPVVAPALATRPVGAWKAFWIGLRQAPRHWPYLLLFYAALVFVSGLLLVPLLGVVATWIGRRMAVAELASGPSPVLMLAAGREAWGPVAPFLGKLFSRYQDWPTILSAPFGLLSLALSLPFNLLSAGVIALFAESADRRIEGGTVEQLSAEAVERLREEPDRQAGAKISPRGRRRKIFWRAVSRWTPLFLLLLAIEVGLMVGLVWLTFWTTLEAVRATGNPLVLLPPLPVLAAILILVPWWFEYARVVAVLSEKKNVLWIVGRSAAVLWRRMGAAALLAIFSFLLPLVFYLVYLLVSLLLPAWFPPFFPQQLFILALVGTRLARIGAQVELLRASFPHPTSNIQTLTSSP